MTLAYVVLRNEAADHIVTLTIVRLPFHYAWVITAVTFVALIMGAGTRGAPGVLLKPLESEFGWDRASISLGVAISLIFFGLGGPLGGTVADRFGPRKANLYGLALIALATFGMLWMRELWQLYLLWGVLIGIGTGAVGNVVGTAVAYRWFRKHRGLVVGLFGGATSAGQLVFVPAMIALTATDGWRAAMGLLAIASAVFLVPVALFMRDRPSDLGLRPYGQAETLTVAQRTEDARATSMRDAMRTRDFWLLASSFFICGYTSNGLIGTHLIPHALEHGFTEAATAGAFGLMGSLNIVGTLASGWLTDRFDNRKLLALYYGFRAIGLSALPLIFEVPYLFLFAAVYGLDWVATVPPTANIVATKFGRASVGKIYGWIFFGHMIGAALAAFAGGLFREVFGDYHLIFISAAIMGFVAVALALRIGPAPKPVPAPAVALSY